MIRWKQAIQTQDFIHNMPQRRRNRQYLCFGLAEQHQQGKRLRKGYLRAADWYRFVENKPYSPKISSRTCQRGAEIVSTCALVYQQGKRLLTRCRLMKIRWNRAIFAQDFIHNMPQRRSNRQYLCFGLAELHQYGRKQNIMCIFLHSEVPALYRSSISDVQL